jgi:single-strand DNA-binding protein
MKAIFLIGNLVRDPEEDVTRKGDTVCRMRVAVDGHAFIDGERVDTTDYYDVNAYGTQAENCLDFLSKGRQVAVIGNQVFGEYELEIGDEIVCYESGDSVKMHPHHVDAFKVEFL